ncbi:hypothetical protein FLK61_35615 [Paenalkalicoccus suaedae]|uniref:Intracellular proteinase inhibitor BsuPI domain-containing protein n=1 Tax=Paenalkalicoccus suaedae TaxID=2592382 RepID=A0A859FF71_9BACI|nr:hypothetical protein [Paenalkalicoccus suaedae]QKS71993.1 hypothetical protein FLK61_35615 [Paenalkalicoccus suaedae]
MQKLSFFLIIVVLISACGNNYNGASTNQNLNPTNDEEDFQLDYNLSTEGDIETILTYTGEDSVELVFGSPLTAIAVDNTSYAFDDFRQTTILNKNHSYKESGSLNLEPGTYTLNLLAKFSVNEKQHEIEINDIEMTVN